MVWQDCRRASANKHGDDLPVIRDNIKKGFLETQSKVNNWVTNLRKKIDGENDEGLQGAPGPATGYRQPQYGSRRSGDYQRRSQDQDRYDADPQVLGDDFTGLQLRDTEGTITVDWSYRYWLTFYSAAAPFKPSVSQS